MQKLMGDKDVGNLRPSEPKPKESADSHLSVTQTFPSNCLLFENIFDQKKVDLRKDPSFFIDIKDQVKTVCSDFGKVLQIYIDQGSAEGRIWVRFDDNDIRGAIKTQESLDN